MTRKGAVTTAGQNWACTFERMAALSCIAKVRETIEIIIGVDGSECFYSCANEFEALFTRTLKKE
jgi:hypothetical protein